MWFGHGTKATKADERGFDMTAISKVANRRCTAIVNQHIKFDSRLSRIATDCYLQGVRDTVDTLKKNGCLLDAE